MWTATGNVTTKRAAAPNELPAFERALANFAQYVDAQKVISQDRCVDGLLDLYNLTTDRGPVGHRSFVERHAFRSSGAGEPDQAELARD